MPEHSTELSITARYAELPRLMAYLEQEALRLGFSTRESARFQLVLEELFSNSVAHGYGGECEQPIAISLQRNSGRLTLIYHDHGLPFDLTKMSAHVPNEEQIGGLGINLILGLSLASRYRREGGSNITELDL